MRTLEAAAGSSAPPASRCDLALLSFALGEIPPGGRRVNIQAGVIQPGAQVDATEAPIGES